ncbi:hypothetical protein L1887_19854 [Cichorium endivia]|nr:hypothetical protein L1887_19854 [Cichorium endivia]
MELLFGVYAFMVRKGAICVFRFLILFLGIRKCNTGSESLAVLSPSDSLLPYIVYFVHRRKMDKIGGGGFERLAAQHSIAGLFMDAIGEESHEPLHLIPTANLTVNLSRARDLKEIQTVYITSRSNSLSHEETASDKYDEEKRSFLISHANLLQELRNLSKAINQTIDLSGFTSQNEEAGTTNVDSSKSHYLYTLQIDELYRLFHSLGDQILYVWSTFLNCDRANKTKVLEHLRNSWAVDKRAEWSIWMVYPKVEMPHQPIRNQVDDSAYHGPRGTLYATRYIFFQVLWAAQPTPNTLVPPLGSPILQAAAVFLILTERMNFSLRLINRVFRENEFLVDAAFVSLILTGL